MKTSLSSKDITAVESCLVRFGPPVGGSNVTTKPVDFTSAATKLARHRDRLIADMAKQLAALLSRGGSRDPTELQRVLAAAEPYCGSDGTHRKVETQRKLVESHYATVVHDAESALKTALVDADNLRELERVAAEHILFHSPHPQDGGEGAAAAPHAHCGQLLQRLEAKIAAVVSGVRDRVRTALTGSAPAGTGSDIETPEPNFHPSELKALLAELLACGPTLSAEHQQLTAHYKRAVRLVRAPSSSRMAFSYV